MAIGDGGADVCWCLGCCGYGGMPVFSFLSGAEQALVWILGHSYVHWGAKRAEVRKEGRQLGFGKAEECIRWIGVQGMMWGRVVPEVHRYASLDWPPDVLVLHVGGNDMGVRSMLEVTRDIKFDVLRLRMAFPQMVIVWSDMIARTSWRLARSVEGVNRARRKVNCDVGRFMARNGGLVARHLDLEEDTWRYLRGDGVHLNAVGIVLWFLGLQDGIERALRVWRGTQG